VTALILLPGMDGSGDLFGGLTAALRAHAPTLDLIIIRYPPRRPLSYDALEALVAPQLPADQDYVLLGESFSGPIAIALAATRPPGLVGLVLCCSFARPPAAWLRLFAPLLHLISTRRPPRSLMHFFLLGRDGDGTLRAALKRAIDPVAPQVMAARMAAVLSVDVRVQLARVQVPMLYLRATRDRLIPGRVAQQMQVVLPALQVADFATPHFLLQIAPREAAARIARFLDDIRPMAAIHA